MKLPTNDFKQLTPSEWKLKVQAELAGLDYKEVLVWGSAEGIQVKPVYTGEDREKADSYSIETTKDWRIVGNFLDDPKQDFSYLYGFRVADKHIQAATKLPDYLDLFFACEQPFDFFSNHDFSSVKNLAYCSFDVIGNFASSGNWHKSKEEDFQLVKKQLSNDNFERLLEVNTSLYQNAGANHVQQIGFALSHAVEYLENFGVEAAPKLFFRTATASNFFFEIAKIRALRKLWNLILNDYNSTASTFIYSETSMRNKSLLDKHNNIIRSGLEAAAAIQGKADVVQIMPFDGLNGGSAFSEELASKQQLLIQRESYFSKFMDPVSGTFFVENLTELMIKNALELFKSLENEGGFLKALAEGNIQKMIQKSAEKEQQAFDDGKLILIGVNKFKNPKDRITPITKAQREIRTQIQPILSKRLSEKIENET